MFHTQCGAGAFVFYGKAARLADSIEANPKLVEWLKAQKRPITVQVNVLSRGQGGVMGRVRKQLLTAPDTYRIDVMSAGEGDEDVRVFMHELGHVRQMVEGTASQTHDEKEQEAWDLFANPGYTVRS